MNRIEFINHLIRQRNYRHYLEITAHSPGDTFQHIHCGSKQTNLPRTPDQFFSVNQHTFDLIFIDGDHAEEQVLKEIEHGFSILNTGGMIILHDCMPPDAWHQREREAYKEGENWNGTVWKAVLRTFNESTYKCFVLDADWGLGVIDTAQLQIPRREQLPEKLEYDKHYPLLLAYTKTVAAYMREQVKVFYHLACMGNWQQVFREQMAQLAKNGFSAVSLTVLGTRDDLKWAGSVGEEYNLDTHVLFHAPELTHFEKPGLLAIEEYARHQEGYVLYLHSKGVSSPADETKAAWRRLMMKELVEGWENCIMQLLNYDAIGVNWRDMPPISHFCGNFWYASTAYLRTLAGFEWYYNHPAYQIWDNINFRRLGCEFWISSGSKPPRILSLVCRNVDFCSPAFWRNR